MRIDATVIDDDESDLRDLETASEYQRHVHDRMPSSQRLLCKASIARKRHSIRNGSNGSDAISGRYSQAKWIRCAKAPSVKRRCTRLPCDTQPATSFGTCNFDSCRGERLNSACEYSRSLLGRKAQFSSRITPVAQVHNHERIRRREVVERHRGFWSSATTFKRADSIFRVFFSFRE